MSTDVLKEFLVAVGFKVDEASMRRVNEGIQNFAKECAKLAVAFEGAALAAAGFTIKLAKGMEEAYNASQRLNSSVERVNALSYAITQAGGSAQNAKASLENLARFMRSAPGAKNMVQSIIGSKTDIRDTTAVMVELGKKFKEMPFAQAKVRADLLGIDETTLMALRDGLGDYMAEYQKVMRTHGVVQEEYAKDAKAFMTRVRELWTHVQAIMMKVGQSLIGKLTPQIEKLKQFLIANSDRIKTFIESISKFVIKGAEIFIRIFTRAGEIIGDLIDWFQALDPEGQKVVKILGMITAAMVALNMSFWTSPIGIILALAGAIFLVWEDYKTWKEGGQHFIDWEKWEPAIKDAKAAILWLGDKFKWLAGDGEGGIGALQVAFAGFATYLGATWIASVLKSIGKFKAGWLGAAAVAAVVIKEMMKSPEEVVADMRARAEWIDDNVNDSSGGRWLGRASNWLRGKVGLEPKFNEDGSTKRSYSGKGLARSLSDKEKKRIAKMAYDKAIARGYTPEQAAGFVAQIQHESGFDPTARGDGRLAHGLFQHHPNRRAAILKGTGINMSTATAEQQVDAALWELENTERNAGNLLRRARSAREAGGILSRSWERPAAEAKEAAGRGQTAENLLPRLKSTVVAKPDRGLTPMSGINTILEATNFDPEKFKVATQNARNISQGSAFTTNTQSTINQFSGSNITQSTTINVNGTADPVGTASAVETVQSRTFENMSNGLQRSFQTAIR